MQFAGDVRVAMRGCSGGFSVVVAQETPEAVPAGDVSLGAAGFFARKVK